MPDESEPTADPRDPRPQRARKIRMTDDRKRVFLRELTEHGIIGWACKQASPGAVGTCEKSFREERERDPEFAEAWDAALDHSNQAILKELHRRAIDGVEEHGAHGAVRTRYSDSLLALMLKSKRFGDLFTERSKVEHSGGITSKKELDIESLPPHKRALLRELLEDEGGPE